MNLQGIARRAVQRINPTISVTIEKSTGYSTQPDGKQVPGYAAPVQVLAQMQALQYNDLVQLDGLNIQGERRALYLDGNWDGVLRPDGQGGDLVTLPDGTKWLVALVLENWSDVDGWVKVAITRQMP